MNWQMKDPCKYFQAQVCRVVIMKDFHGVTLSHMRSYVPAIGKKATTSFICLSSCLWAFFVDSPQTLLLKQYLAII